MSTSVIVSREVTDQIVGRLTGISPSYYRLNGNIRDLNIITANAQKKWDALLEIAKSQTIDPRWADIDFDKVNAELRDLRAQVGRLQAHIDRTQPVVAGADGYVQPQAQGKVECFGLEHLELVAAQEREACAALIESMGDYCGGQGEPSVPGPRALAAAIRARSQKQ